MAGDQRLPQKAVWERAARTSHLGAAQPCWLSTQQSKLVRPASLTTVVDDEDNDVLSASPTQQERKTDLPSFQLTIARHMTL